MPVGFSHSRQEVSRPSQMLIDQLVQQHVAERLACKATHTASDVKSLMPKP